MKKTLLYLLTAVTLVSFNACEKDEDEKSPDFVGEWTLTEVWEDGNDYVHNLALTESTVENTVSTELIPGTQTTVGGMKGALSYTETLMTIQLNEIASGEYNMTTHQYTLTWYGKGTTEYNNAIEEFGGEIMVLKYEVSGDTLFLYNDDNGNGTYDEDEKATYTRVK